MGMLTAGATWVWPLALALYLAFRLWYDGWRRPLSTAEVEHFMQAAGQTVGAGHTDMSVLRDFLAQDDGREFVMCNLVRLHPQAMPHPLTGVMTEPSALLREYFRQFVPVLLMNGGTRSSPRAKWPAISTPGTRPPTQAGQSPE